MGGIVMKLFILKKAYKLSEVNMKRKEDIVSQRDKMRELYKSIGNNEVDLIHEYAAAEQRGEVERKCNKSNHSPEEYATRLLADGLRKGWLQ